MTIRVKLAFMFGTLFLIAGSALAVFFFITFEASFPTGNSSALAALAQADPPNSSRMNIARFSGEDHDKLLAAATKALDKQRSEALASVLRQSVLAVGVVAIGAVGAGWLLAGRALRPMQRITETARKVAGRNLHERIDLHGPDDEVKELADTFDAMLERLDRSFDSQRLFVANASHELRTPLAVNRTLLEVASEEEKLPPEVHSSLTMLLATTERTERMLDSLLVLARSDGHVLRQKAVDLADVAAHALEETATEAAAAGVTVHATPDSAPTTGDPSLLERVALNLVLNGIRHNHAGGTVTIRTGPHERGWVGLHVRNTGPHVPSYEIDGLFEPFHRLGQARIADRKGVGLGLSIVRSVVSAHGGRIETVAQAEGGLDIKVILPAATKPAAEPRHGRRQSQS